MSEREILSKVHSRNLVHWARGKNHVYVLTADLTNSCEAEAFKHTYKNRYLSMGIAEQNMIAFAGGMAREGMIPLIHTFAVFIYRRAFDQIAMSVAYPNLPVKMLGFLPGILTPGGVTHQAIEDIAVMRSLPNMTILECADATEVESVLDVLYQVDGPVYVRMLRGAIPRLFPADEPMRLGVARCLNGAACAAPAATAATGGAAVGDVTATAATAATAVTGGAAVGDVTATAAPAASGAPAAGKSHDLVFVTSGVCTEEALTAAELLRGEGVSIGHYHISTLKPFDQPQIIEAIASSRFGAITMENHSIIGGLGSILAEQLAEAGVGRPLRRLGLQDTFAHGASKPYVMREYGIDARALLQASERAIGESLGLEDREIKVGFAPAGHSRDKIEAL